MRLSELSRFRCEDAEGQPLGRVKDVRLERQGDAWVVTGILVGGAVAERLGFLHGGVERPVLLARLVRHFARHARVIPWDRTILHDDHITADAHGDDLPRPEAEV